MTDEPRLPLPSEDTGDLTAEPASGVTDDALVAREEGLPYTPPTERIAGDEGSDDARLEADDAIQATSGAPRDGALEADVLDALRASDLTSGAWVRILVEGTTVLVRGAVDSIDTSEEIVGLIGDVPGVDQVVDEIEISGV